MPQFAPDSRPNFEELYEVAATQEGLFATDQAHAAGYSRRLLSHYTTTGKFSRVDRGIYRLVHQGLDRGFFRRVTVAPALAYIEKYGKGG